MKIKSLLIGSAAALTAGVTGAKAADPIVIPEPEPMEYVRICDVYGAGFFYIPGTETCLRVSGYVWYQIAAGTFGGDALTAGGGAPLAPFASIGTETVGYNDSVADDGWMVSTRARLNVDARSETEWGTLRAYLRYQATWGAPADGNATVDQAYIELGGLIMGYTESFWADSKIGGAANYGSHSWGGMYYGYQQRHLIGYRFEGGNGFFGALALEDDAHTPFAAGSDGYMPDVVAKIGVNQGWGAVWAAVGYDESFDGSVNTLNALTGTVNSGGFGAQVGAQINVPNMPGSSLRVIGYYADGAHSYNVGSPSINFAASTGGLFPLFQYNGALFGGAEWSILGSYNHQFTPTFGASVAVQYFNDLYIAGTDVSTGVDAWGAELSTVWTPIENFEIRTELHYDDVGEVVPGFDPDGTFSGYLRFTRYF